MIEMPFFPEVGVNAGHVEQGRIYEANFIWIDFLQRVDPYGAIFLSPHNSVTTMIHMINVIFLIKMSLG